VGSIERISEDNSMFRKVVFTSDREQLVAMALQPREDIGLEIHEGTDQFFRVESGTGSVIVANQNGILEEIRFGPGDSFQVPAGTYHNVVAETTVKLYTIYSPPHHPYDTLDITKDDARVRSLTSARE
jgi:mannose-6-phosphate isomerase-like protein (cupin superfamily)